MQINNLLIVPLSYCLTTAAESNDCQPVTDTTPPAAITACTARSQTRDCHWWKFVQFSYNNFFYCRQPESRQLVRSEWM